MTERRLTPAELKERHHGRFLWHAAQGAILNRRIAELTEEARRHQGEAAKALRDYGATGDE